ncbi:MAG: hypothetical protein KC912_04685 [Proteobacteria bacterium]|nr:hypothetical protein [Pseudomonadota bacterium]
MRTSFLVFALMLSACDGEGSAVSVTGKAVPDFFPFDGAERSWTFESDTELEHRMVGVMNPEKELINDGATEVITVDYSLVCVDEDDTTCTGSDYRTVRMSSDAGNGVLLYGISVNGGDELTFDPPAVLGDRSALIDEEWVTETGGTTITSKFTGSEDCAIRWTDEWNDCIVLEIDDGGANTGIAGTIWAVASYNMVAMQIGADTGRWELSSATFVAE